MQSVLGKLYQKEITFTAAFDPARVAPVTSDPADLAKIASVASSAFRSLTMIRTKTFRVLVDTSIGAVLLTCRAV